MSKRKSAEWYDFVPLPPGGKRPAPEAKEVTHARHLAEGHHSGYIELELVAASPIHVGSGVAELSEDAGQEKGSVVKGMARVNGQPVIPATSLKGALRSNYETITYSCLGPIRIRATEKYSRNSRKSELPRAVIDQLPPDLQRQAEEAQWPPRITVELEAGALSPWQPCRPSKGKDLTAGLCPACALFGTEGLQGRVWFDDAKVVGPLPRREPLRIASLYGPRLHRAGSLRVVPKGRRTLVRVQRLKGRKAYYRVRLGQVPARGNVPLDYLPKGTRLRTRLYFRNLTPTELGGIIAALGIVPQREFPFRVGGGKPLGLGYLEPHLQGAYLIGDAEQWLDFDAQPRKVVDKVTDDVTLDWIMAFARDKDLCYEKGWRRLREITRRAYVPAEGGGR
jgi:hypothetical protein